MTVQAAASFVPASTLSFSEAACGFLPHENFDHFDDGSLLIFFLDYVVVFVGPAFSFLPLSS